MTQESLILIPKRIDYRLAVGPPVNQIQYHASKVIHMRETACRSRAGGQRVEGRPALDGHAARHDHQQGDEQRRRHAVSHETPGLRSGNCGYHSCRRHHADCQHRRVLSPHEMARAVTKTGALLEARFER